MSVTTGPLGGGALAHVLEAVTEMKRGAKPSGRSHSVPIEDVTPDTPLPFCIQKLWYDLHCLQYATHLEQAGKSQSPATWAFEKDSKGNPITGDALQVRRPKFRQHKDERNDPEKIRKSTQENLVSLPNRCVGGQATGPTARIPLSTRTVGSERRRYD